MNAAATSGRHRALRWLAPAAVVGVAALVATGVFRAHASSADLPRTSPAALIAAVQKSALVPGFSGTVVSQFALGLPELPSLGSDDPTSFSALLSGSHTLQVWYGGATQQRIALLGTTDETDLFRDGREVWQWSSADRVAQHSVLPARAARVEAPVAASASALAATTLTPAQLAQRALHSLDPSTRVHVAGNETVADRSAYDLVLTPRSAITKVASVHIAVDGTTKLPLEVVVYARGETAPSIDVAFTSIRFAHQPKRTFVFTPPPDAKVRQLDPVTHATSLVPAARTAPGTTDTAGSVPPRVTGAGWARIVRLDPGKAAVAELAKQPTYRAFTPVSGPWGSGRLLDSSLVSVLLTADGRVFAGAVDPEELYTAAGTK